MSESDRTSPRPIEEAAADFLTSRRIAVTGVSRDAGSHSGNAIRDRLRERGYEVFAVNPNAERIDGERCYANLDAIPGSVALRADRGRAYPASRLTRAASPRPKG